MSTRPGGPPQHLPAVFLPGLAGHAAEFDDLAQRWPHGPTLCLDPIYHGDLSIAGQAVQVAEQAHAAGFDRFVMVGHSQGGIVGLELAATRPDVVAAVAVLDSPVLVPPPLRAALRIFVALLGTPVGSSLLQAFFRATFVEEDRAKERSALMSRLAAVPRDVARRLVGAAFGYRGATALAALNMPAVCVRGKIPTPLDRLPPSVQGAEVSGVGHWIHIHRPEVLQGILDQLVASISQEAK